MQSLNDQIAIYNAVVGYYSDRVRRLAGELMRRAAPPFPDLHPPTFVGSTQETPVEEHHSITVTNNGLSTMKMGLIYLDAPDGLGPDGSRIDNRACSFGLGKGQSREIRLNGRMMLEISRPAIGDPDRDDEPTPDTGPLGPLDGWGANQSVGIDPGANDDMTTILHKVADMPPADPDHAPIKSYGEAMHELARHPSGVLQLHDHENIHAGIIRRANELRAKRVASILVPAAHAGLSSTQAAAAMSAASVSGATTANANCETAAPAAITPEALHKKLLTRLNERLNSPCCDANELRTIADAFATLAHTELRRAELTASGVACGPGTATDTV